VAILLWIASHGEGVVWTFLAAEEDVSITKKVLEELPFKITDTVLIQDYSDNEEGRKLRKALAWLVILVLTCLSMLLIISILN
jgi:hypothetical protein